MPSMRRMCLAVAALSVLALLASAQDRDDSSVSPNASEPPSRYDRQIRIDHRGEFQLYGVAGKSCRAWVAERATPDGAASLQWVLGYLSAYGVERSFRVAAGGDTTGKLQPTKREEIEHAVDKYCGERHPDSDLWGAAEDLIRQLGGSRPAPPPVREYR